MKRLSKLGVFGFLLGIGVLGVGLCAAMGAEPKAAKKFEPQPWGSWVENDFPFFSSILDARRAGVGEHNLTPRGLVLNLGRECWACFDTDLLRVAALWRGKGVTDKALAPGSYHDPGRKTPGGQFPAPQMDGKLWLGNAILPGWQEGEEVRFTDPREPAPTAAEVGRGALPEGMGRFRRIRLEGAQAVLEYEVFGSGVRERWGSSEREGKRVIERHVRVEAHGKPLWLVLGAKQNGPSQEIETGVSVGSVGEKAKLVPHESLWVVRVEAHAEPVTFCVAFCDEQEAPTVAANVGEAEPPIRRWPQQAVSRIVPSRSKEAYGVDKIELPANNPWKRAIRSGDIQFLPDGTGVVVTVDGDVWKVSGFSGESLTWKRFASGLHEPLTAAIRDGEIFVFDRNGIWRLLDSNGDGEADVHELFSNAFAQTADMREFPSTIRLAPGGEFVIAKGGQEATTLGKHNGSVLRISADGRRATVLGYGFRQPNLGVHPVTGLVTASDQEGQYIPSTPLHIVKDRQFYGFLSDKLPREQYPAPIAAPWTWIPHSVNGSAMSQVWLIGAKLGPLNDSLVHIGFNKPQIFSVRSHERGGRPQAAVTGITEAFHFTPLNGSVNPLDGQLYLAGFQVIGWGNTIDTLSGMGRIRYNAGVEVGLPREVVAMAEGVLLRFDVELAEGAALQPESYSVAMWDYKRAYTYGSALYRADGSKGMDLLTPSSAYLSKDRKAVFVGVPGMRRAMQLRVGWTLVSARGTAIEQNAYTTPYELPKFDPAVEGFGSVSVDLTPRAAAAAKTGPVTVEEGRRLSQVLGCVACHSTGAQDYFHVGPKWLGLYGSERAYVTPDKKKGKTMADEAYLRESILDPHAKTVQGFERGEYAMPSYAGLVTDSQVEALLLFIKSLRSNL